MDKELANTSIPEEEQGFITEPPANKQQVMSKRTSIIWTLVIFAVGILCVILFFQIDKHNEVSDAIRSWGGFGIIVAILLMALFCVIPVPSEFLMVMNMKIFGVWWGIWYTWIGAMLGAVAVFVMARYIGRGLLHSFVSTERVLQVDEWVEARGAVGLLMARLIPLPFIVVNYTAGVLGSVTLFEFIWTTGVGLLPYDLGAALVFLGVSKNLMVWLVLGGIAIAAIWVLGYVFNRNVEKTKRWAH